MVTPSPGLGEAGRALWAALLDAPEGQLIELSKAETVTLELACRQADDLAGLEAQLVAEGLTVTGSRGQARLSGLPTEIRLQRAALARLIALVAVPAEDEEEGLVPDAVKARRAAQARWRRDAARRARERTVAGG